LFVRQFANAQLIKVNLPHEAAVAATELAERGPKGPKLAPRRLGTRVVAFRAALSGVPGDESLTPAAGTVAEVKPLMPFANPLYAAAEKGIQLALAQALRLGVAIHHRLFSQLKELSQQFPYLFAPDSRGVP
jgi:hypothetical protein